MIRPFVLRFFGDVSFLQKATRSNCTHSTALHITACPSIQRTVPGLECYPSSNCALYSTQASSSNARSRTAAINTPMWSASGRSASNNPKNRGRDNFLSSQIAVFLAVHAKTLRNTSDFISALLEEFIFLFWDLVSLSPLLTFVTSPSGNFDVQETLQSWSWHSRVNTFSLNAVSVGVNGKTTAHPPHATSSARRFGRA